MSVICLFSYPSRSRSSKLIEVLLYYKMDKLFIIHNHEIRILTGDLWEVEELRKEEGKSAIRRGQMVNIRKLNQLNGQPFWNKGHFQFFLITE